MATSVVQLHFHGPFSWTGEDGVDSVFEVEMGREAGIYLWTIRYEDAELAYYVGQTGRSFSQRMHEHFKEHAAGCYHLYEPAAFGRGEKKLLWPGIYGRDPKYRLEGIRRFSEFSPAIVALCRLYRFHLAPLHAEQRMRQRVEAALAQHLCAQPGVVGGFQDTGIRYSPRVSDEETVIASITSSCRLLGLPNQLQV